MKHTTGYAIVGKTELATIDPLLPIYWLKKVAVE